jgi:hypothetical protein
MAVDLQPELRPSRGAQAEGTTARVRTLDVLFVMRSLHYLRFFQTVLELLAERGHRVRLLLESRRHGQREQAWLERMLERENFTCEVANHFTGRHPARMRAIRYDLEHVRSLDPAFVWAQGRRKRAKKRFVRRPVARLAKLPLVRRPVGLRALNRTLTVLDRVLPVPREAAAYLDRVRPDVLALSDDGAPGSLHSTYVRAAKARGIPTAICVASWDNLGTRQQLRDVPHALLVWNSKQVREATEIHGVPPERVHATGAPNFDQWFSWQPRPRDEFLAKVGLDRDRPFVLWVGGALYRDSSPQTEAEYAVAWVARLRASTDGDLRELGVLLRPHPYRLSDWRAVDVSGLGNTVIWPRADLTMPVDDQQKADYYDSIFHSAVVVGMNTSAMIEASIVGRPVLAVIEPDFEDSQLGTFHVRYLLESSGGAVREARSAADSLVQLRALLDGDDEVARRAREFVHEFVRPHGLERPAAPIFVETLERLATPVAAERDPLWVVAARPAVLVGFWASDLVRAVRARLRLTELRLLAAARVRRVAKRARHVFFVSLAAVRARIQPGAR